MIILRMQILVPRGAQYISINPVLFTLTSVVYTESYNSCNATV